MDYKDTNPRRATKKRKKTKKRSRLKKGFIVFLLIFVLCVTLVTLSLTVFFKTEEITVSGNTVYESSKILKESGVETGDNMFLVFDSLVEKRLKNNCPFVDSVKIKRTLPNKMEIVVTEATEHYCYSYAGQFFTANKDNRVLAKYSKAPAGLVLMKVSGLTNVEIGENVELTNEDEKTYLTKLLAVLDKYKITATTIDITDMLTIKVTVSDRIVVNFGGPTDLEGKTAHLATILKNLKSDARGSVNLSVWSSNKNEGYFIKDNMQ